METETTQPLTRSQKTNADITTLLRARNVLLWIVTREELRVERAIAEASAIAGYEVSCWDCAAGITELGGKAIASNAQDPQGALRWLRDSQTRRVLIMRDLHKWFDPMVLRNLRNLSRDLIGQPRGSARAIVILTPSAEVPPELAGHAVVLDYPLPERPEIAAILSQTIGNLPDDIAVEINSKLVNGERDRAIDAAVGLTAEEASSCYSRSLVTTRAIDAKMVAEEKRRVIARERVLTWQDPDPRGLAAVGGLDVLKDWLVQRKLALSQKARAFGLPSPKGVLIVGLPGTGKSLTAKAVATAWSLPLLRLDLGALRSKYVGESEANIRKALAVAETVAPCCLWLDEIEKALAGSSGPQGDGGVAADALGTVLSWLQERQGSVFVIATANDVRALPPELLRKGRFDELFFVDLPQPQERAEILAAALRQHGRDPEKVGKLTDIVRETEGFVGAEIAALIPDALFAAFADGERDIKPADILLAARNVTPLSKTAGDKLSDLRAWAKGKARRASTEANNAKDDGGRFLDLEPAAN